MARADWSGIKGRSGPATCRKPEAVLTPADVERLAILANARLRPAVVAPRAADV